MINAEKSEESVIDLANNTLVQRSRLEIGVSSGKMEKGVFWKAQAKEQCFQEFDTGKSGF